MKTKRIITLLSLLLTLIMVMSACNSGTSTTTTAGTAAATQPATEAPSTIDLKVGVVCSAAGQNDSGYNKAIVDKVNALASEKGFHAQIIEPTNGVPNAIETLAEDGYQLIFSMEYDFEALVNGVGGAKPLAEQYPDTTFVIFNDNPNLTDAGDVKHKNVIAVLFNVNESSYLAGYLYGLVNEAHDKLFSDDYQFVSTDEARVAGFIGGTNSNGILVYSYAFMQGINDAAAETDVKYDYYAKYDAGFTDSALGSTVAGTYFDNKANIVFADAGTVGDGITSKAKEVGRLSIQVDANLDGQQPGHVLTSVLKLTDVPGESIVNAYLAGKIAEQSNLQTFGLKSGATDITDLATISEYIQDKDIWNEIVEKTNAKKQAIIDGSLKVIDAQSGDTFDAAKVPNVIVK